MTSPSVRIIIVNYNGAAVLPRCLSAVQEQSFRDFELVVVDNASTDGSAPIALPDDERFRAIHLDRNIGFAAANNLAAQDCQARWLVLLNPDAFPEPDWLAELTAAAAADPGTAMFGSTQLRADRPELYDGTGDVYSLWGFPARRDYGAPAAWPHPEAPCFGPCAAAALYDTRTFQQAGGFDERFFCYGEDVDLAFRLRLLGHGARQASRAVVWHVGSAIAGEGSVFSAYHLTRNQIWILVKNMPAPLLPIALLGHLAFTLAALARPGHRPARRAVMRGLLDGIAGLPAMVASRRVIQASRRLSTAKLLNALDWVPPGVRRRGQRSLRRAAARP